MATYSTARRLGALATGLAAAALTLPLVAIGPLAGFGPLASEAGAGIGASAGASAGAGAAAGDPNRLETVTAAAARPVGSRLVAAVAPSATIEGAVGLKPRDESALASFIVSVTTKGSPMFHRYVTAPQFASRFGPATATLRAVESVLSRDGLRVGSVSANHLLVHFSGTAGTIESAFHTGLDEVRLPGGSLGRATTTAIRLPALIAPQVQVVAGLDDLVHAHSEGLLRASRAEAAAHHHAVAPTHARTAATTSAAGSPQACPGATEAAAAYGGLTDDQIASAYGAFGLYHAGDEASGDGVAVFELEPFARSDINTFDRCYFGKAMATEMSGDLFKHSVDGGQPPGPGSGEAVLDVEDVSGLAPLARKDVYDAPNTTFGSLDEYNAIISDDADQVVSTSWGLCETALEEGAPGTLQEEDSIFQEAAAQGQSIFAAAGDSGSDDCNSFYSNDPVPPVLSVDDPGSQPYVVSVGGTTIDDATQPPLEHVWNDGAAGGAGGGGISNAWVMPSWQAGSTVPGIDAPGTVATAEEVEGDRFCAGNAGGATFGGEAGEPCREVPDVTAQADQFTGAITVYSSSFGPGAQGWTTIGGTSSSAPLWAAMTSLVNTSSACSGEDVAFSGGEAPDVGFASPLLYGVASDPSAYAASFNDITAGNNDVDDIDNGKVFPATTGYDMASGLGSPQLTSPSGGDGLAYYLCSYGTSPTRPSVSGLHPSTLSTGGGESVTVTGSNFESAGVPDVSQVWVNNYLVPAADVVVKGATSLQLNDLPAGSDLVPTDPVSDGAGRAVVTVTLGDGETSAVTPASTLEVVDTTSGSSPSTVPAVTGVSTWGGPESGGNTVTVFGSGFDRSVSSVTFGGVPAISFRVLDPYEISAVVPAFTSGRTSCATARNPADDLCQSEVVVTNTAGPSKQYPILAAFEGTISINPLGVFTAPPGCQCELTPAASEYDYFPAPRITGLSTGDDPQDYASENGGTVLTITGAGLDDFGLEELFVGPRSQNASLDTNLNYVSGTEIQVTTPPEPITSDVAEIPVSVKTLAGISNTVDATYAGLPSVSSVSPAAAPDTGGTAVAVGGSGLADTYMAMFVDLESPFSLGTAYTFDHESDSAVSVLNPQQNPAIVHVQLCTTTGCSIPGPHDEMTIYPPGDPVVTGTSPASGPAEGGTPVTITGHNLGCVTAVWFGHTIAESFSNVAALLDCGSTSAVTVDAPPGRPGKTVLVTLDTVESTATGYGRSHAARHASFTWQPSAPSGPVIVRLVAGPRSLSVSWDPPRTDGGSPVTYYVARAQAKGFPMRTVRLGTAARSETFSELYSGTTWVISVTAHNLDGAGITAQVRGTPGTPSG